MTPHRFSITVALVATLPWPSGLAAQTGGCPPSPTARSVAGIVREARPTHRTIANATVTVTGTKCWTQSDDRGAWRLKRAPTDSFTLTVAFIGYVTKQVLVPASPADETSMVLELDEYGGPDSASTEPVPQADLRDVLEATLVFYARNSADAAAHLNAAATLTGVSPPTAPLGGPLIVIDTAGRSAWKQVSLDWLTEWRERGLITEICGTWNCKDLALATYLELQELPRRTVPDTAYVKLRVDLISLLDCQKGWAPGHFEWNTVRVVRTGDAWHGESFPGGRWMFGSTSCHPEDLKKH
ncbi:MAG TPA: carboxypeptidase-like regulatory domain-containing protein [Gemmatimonadales bacterium]|nr:carboxypeptidase-like regulatory domain-containing protein [Gemmatimonadales bacterium]